MYRNAARPGSHASSVRSPATLERSGAYSATGQGLTIAAPKQWASFLVQSTTGAKLRVCIDSLLLSCHLRVPCCCQCFTGCSNCPCERTHIIAERCRCHNDAYVGCTAPVHLSRMEVQNDGGQHVATPRDACKLGADGGFESDNEGGGKGGSRGQRCPSVICSASDVQCRH